MPDDRNTQARKTSGTKHDARELNARGLRDGELRSLARQAIRLMATKAHDATNLPDHRLNLMCDAFLDEHDDPRHLVLLRLRQNGISLCSIIDDVVPAIARCLGKRWADDEISFADVTIGTARLQETVRALGFKPECGPPMTRGPIPAGGHEAHAPVPIHWRKRILLIIPRPEHHTLGTFVAADQLRRMGYSVDIAMDQHPQQMARTVRYGRYSMVGITAAGRRALASAKELVDIIRSNVMRVTPIVLGGSILEFESDVRKFTGVDFVVPDVSSALRLCGLETHGQSALVNNGANDNG